jgi:phosphoserine phosphatase RsbU/P
MDTASAGHFVTAFFALIDGPERNIAWVRAGHDPALLYDPAKDMFEPLNGSGIALGVDPHARYTMNTRSGLPKGAIVLIATDGLWEVGFGSDGVCGREVVRDLVRKHRNESAADIAEVVKKAAHGLHGGSKAEDDMTFVAVKFV